MSPEARRTIAMDRMATAYRQIQKAKAADHGRWKGTGKRQKLADRIQAWRLHFWASWAMLPESRYCNNPFTFTKSLLKERLVVKYLPCQMDFLEPCRDAVGRDGM